MKYRDIVLYGHVAERCTEVIKEMCPANYANFGIFTSFDVKNRAIYRMEKWPKMVNEYFVATYG